MLAKTIAESLHPLAGDLDIGIAELVEAMREQGFDTVSSCQGHFRPNDFRHAKPNVVFVALHSIEAFDWLP